MSGDLTATAWSLHLPGTPVAEVVSGRFGPVTGAWATAEHAAPDQAKVVLGRKGLLAKDDATRLALCAVHRALGRPAGERPGPGVDPGTAVVACSNLGNVQAVARVAATVAAGGSRDVSVLDAPNVSSNVIAGAVALRFGFGGPNLMVCSGATAGLDGLRLAGLLLRSRRARRVVLVGAEPDDEVATALHAGTPALRAGAACVVLEAGPAGPGAALIRPVPDGAPYPEAPVARIGRELAGHWGDHYGARGVVGLALAAHLAVDEARGPVAVEDEGEGAFRRALVRVAEGAAR